MISLDFELYWGIFGTIPLGECRKKMLEARETIPKMLDLFETFDVAATWATVGYLMCESKEELLETMPSMRPDYHDKTLATHQHIPEIGRNEREDPFHFAPSIVREISARNRQEIATHTFSHYYCLDPGQTLHTFAADLDAALAIGARRGHQIRSIVFPRNQFNQEYLDICRDKGIIAVRGNPLTPWHKGADHQAYNSLICKAGRLLDAYLPLNTPRRIRPDLALSPLPVNIPATRFLRPWSKTLSMLEPRRIELIKDELTKAAMTASLCHLWWHPHNFGENRVQNLNILAELLEHFEELRETYSMQSQTMEGLALQLKDFKVPSVNQEALISS